MLISHGSSFKLTFMSAVGVLLTHFYSNVHFLDTCIAYKSLITENGRYTLTRPPPL